jgi:DNA-directed RNA polymerase subunit K/omega
MELDATERLEKICKNRYEAVLLVAKHARRLNLERMKAQSQAAQMGEEEEQSQENVEKIPNQALSDVLEGRVEFERPEGRLKSGLKRV